MSFRTLPTLASLALVSLAGAVGWTPARVEPARHSAAVERVSANENLRAAGSLHGRQLRLRLDTRLGMWHPDGDSAPGALVPAFAEQGVGRALQIPGPLLRVPAGTEVVVTLTNSLRDGLLTVHGLASRPAAPGSTSDSVQVPAGASRELRFRLDSAGTYYYWGTTNGRRFGMRTGEDAQLAGAIVVDPPQGTPPRDRILVISQWSDTAATEFLPAERMRRALFVVNGRSWPRTSRLEYVVGDTVRWRVINASADVHPMHLHGFYYRVDSRGDGTVDTRYTDAARDKVATERMLIGSTMALTWIPERAGNWLFHCHVTAHFSRRGSLGIRTEDSAADAHALHASNHALEGMGGLVVGVTVAPRRTESHAHARDSASDLRQLRLLVRPAVGSTQARPLYTFSLQEGGAEPAPVSARSGPVIALTRGRPVAITIVNRLPEPTAVHWHGIELESYFDGVAGFSGGSGRLTPGIAPGDSFVARFTPPRAGTFIYHTHVNERRQQPAGLSGALVVLEPGTRFDAATDIPVLITSPPDSADETHAVLLNGRLAPDTLAMRAGMHHRLRLINITTGRPNLRVELRQDTSLVQWRMLAKDGADLPTGRRLVRSAQQLISVGETIDVEVTPRAPGLFRLEARTSSGRLLATLPLRVWDASDSRSGPSEDQIAIRRVLDEWLAALRRGDLAALERLIAPDYRITVADGRVLDRTEDLAPIREAKFRFDSATVADVDIRVFGDAAVVTGIGSYRISSPNGHSAAVRERFTDVYVRRAGAWQPVASHSTPLRPEP